MKRRGRRPGLLLGVYLFMSARATGWARRRLNERLAAGKEHPTRMSERMGVTTLERPEGDLIWFHAASVGEAASLLELLRRLERKRAGVRLLVTTVTVTSEQFLAERLPDGCLHQFAPVDVRPWVDAFLSHWRPDLAVWTESELWPATLWETRRRGTAMLLINARISSRSFRRWRALRPVARRLLGFFDAILAQDDLAGRQLLALGADPERLRVVGTLKEGSAPLEHDEDERVRLARAIDGRPVWLAASTHSGEEAMVVAAHRAARRSTPMLTLILAPRHPDRGDAIAADLRAQGFIVAQRSRGEALGADTEIYLADTLGEMGLWYRVAPVSFVGGSLVPVGGHNPFEPAQLGSAILHGPHVRNFQDAYARLRAGGAAVEVADADALAAALVRTLSPDVAAAMAEAGWRLCSDGAQVTDQVLEEVCARLDRAA